MEGFKSGCMDVFVAIKNVSGQICSQIEEVQIILDSYSIPSY